MSSSDINPDRGTKVIYLQATVINDEPALKHSADIISQRLKFYGLNSFDVTVSGKPGQIKIVIPDDTDISEIERLVTSRGEIAFYETYNQEEISELFKADNQIYKLVSRVQEQKSTSPVLGCTENREKTDEYLKSPTAEKNCILLWGSEKENSGYCLFALKTTSEIKPLLVRSDIESVEFNTSDNVNHNIHIRLKPGASVIFAGATVRSIGKCIAITIDDKVYASPVVRDEIKGGEIEVTGSFNSKEIRYFPDIFNTDTLPLTFTLIK
jgi:preprotein translocase subunit SecD